MAEQFRVVWKREGLSVKRKVFGTRRAAERLIVLLGPEPWKALGHEPDEPICCNGYMCGCGGETYRTKDEQYRKDAPPVEWTRLECRPVGAWSSVASASEPEPSSATPPKDPDGPRAGA